MSRVAQVRTKRSRSATESIRGYFYQFDHTILKLLRLQRSADVIIVEGVEDIDIESSLGQIAIQCKYYEATDYNHSIIGKPIREMLGHFASTMAAAGTDYHYMLHCHFRTGIHKYPPKVELDFLKEKLLTYNKNKVEHRCHFELGLNDKKLESFLSRLSINIRGSSFEAQSSEVINSLKLQFKCEDFEAEHYFYNNAIKIVRDLASEKAIQKRRISKGQFLKRIDCKMPLFNLWHIQFLGEQRYCADMRKKHFSRLNISSFERFFLIEIPSEGYIRSNVKGLIMEISKKWSKLLKNEPNPICPYIYLHNLKIDELLGLKMELQAEGIKFVDGFDFHGAQFNANSLSAPILLKNPFKIRFINNIDFIEPTLAAISRTKEIFQFYQGDLFFKREFPNINHVKIPFPTLAAIKEII